MYKTLLKWYGDRVGKAGRADLSEIARVSRSAFTVVEAIEYAYKDGYVKGSHHVLEDVRKMEKYRIKRKLKTAIKEAEQYGVVIEPKVRNIK